MLTDLIKARRLEIAERPGERDRVMFNFRKILFEVLQKLDEETQMVEQAVVEV